MRRLAAILDADVVGYSRVMGLDEAGTFSALKACRSTLILPTIAAHSGRIVKQTGDGLLAEFASVVEAVNRAKRCRHASWGTDRGSALDGSPGSREAATPVSPCRPGRASRLRRP